MVYIFVTIYDKEIKGGVCHEVIQFAPRSDGTYRNGYVFRHNHVCECENS